MTNTFLTLSRLREGWFVKHDSRAVLLQPVLTRLTQMKASPPSSSFSPSCSRGRKTPAHFFLYIKAPPFLLPFLGCHGGIRCQGMRKTERDSSPPPRSGCEHEANSISPGCPLAKQPLASPARCICRCISVMVLCFAKHMLPSIPDKPPRHRR